MIRVKTKCLAVGMLCLFLTTLPEKTTGVALVFAQVPEVKASLLAKTDFDHESSALITNFLYRRLSNSYKSMLPSGAYGANVNWESNQKKQWYIEEQRTGEDLVIGGLIKQDSRSIKAGFKMFDWGFARQAADGSFRGTAAPFHSTSFFVQAVAHTLLVMKQSPQADKYAAQIARYTPLVHRAAHWMISPSVWRRGTARNAPYTHRRYLVAAALGLTGQLTQDKTLIKYSRRAIEEGLSMQSPDGNNPEKGGYDSSYHMVGLVYAQRWAKYFPKDSLTPRVVTMIDRGLAWEETRILPTGEISSKGNSRTAGQERGRTHKVKKVSYKSVFRGFAYWSSVTNNPKWAAIARKVARFYERLF